MAVNAWDNTTPTNSNTVKDTTPGELIGLKNVNLLRPRQICGGTADVPYNFNLSSGVYVSYDTIKYISTHTFEGAWAVAGEYTCTQDGWYKVEAGCERFGAANGLATELEVLKIEKFTGGAWSDVAEAQVPGKTYLPNTTNSTLLISKVFQLTAGDKIRVQRGMKALTNLGGGTTPQTTATLNNLYIEFIRTP